MHAGAGYGSGGPGSGRNRRQRVKVEARRAIGDVESADGEFAREDAAADAAAAPRNFLLRPSAVEVMRDSEGSTATGASEAEVAELLDTPEAEEDL